MAVGVGLNGFGRVGRRLLRELLRRGGPPVRAIAEINPQGRDPAELTANYAYLLAQDSLAGPYKGTVSAQGSRLLVDGQQIAMFYLGSPELVDWAATGASLVVEASGQASCAAMAPRLLEQGVRKVIITQRARCAQVSLVPGLNLQEYDPARHHLVSTSTCTANALAPLLKIIDQSYGIAAGGVASVHPALSGDTLLDAPAAQWPAGRSGLGLRALASGIADSTAELLPHLAGRLSALTLRTPSEVVNALIAHLVLARPPAALDQVQRLLERAVEGPLAGVAALERGFMDRPRAAADFAGDPHSALVDLNWLSLKGPLLRLFIWHDNEYGYVCRVADVLAHVIAALD